MCELDFGAARPCLPNELFGAIKKLCSEVFGELGWGKAASQLAVKHVDPSTRLCIVRSSTECKEQIHAVLALLKTAGGTPVSLCVRDTCSTIRTLKRSYAMQHLRVTGRSLSETGSASSGEAIPLFWESLDVET